MSPLSKEKISILVVDDDPKIREMLQAFFALKSDDFICVTAADTQQAFLKIANQDFHIFIIDNVMPGKSGIEFALHLKKHPKYYRTPVLLMSGALMQEDVIKAIEGGIREIIVKPFALKNLMDKLTPIIKKMSTSH